VALVACRPIIELLDQLPLRSNRIERCSSNARSNRSDALADSETAVKIARGTVELREFGRFEQLVALTNARVGHLPKREIVTNQYFVSPAGRRPRSDGGPKSIVRSVGESGDVTNRPHGRRDYYGFNCPGAMLGCAGGLGMDRDRPCPRGRRVGNRGADVRARGLRKATTVEAIQRALENSGVIFIDANDGGPGARLRKG
jgi:hypothetical protein